MTALSSNYYSKEKLISIAKENNISEKFFEEFINHVEKDKQEMPNDIDLGENEISQSAVDFALEFFTKFNGELQKGHSEEWARLYSESIEEHPHAFNDAYLAVKKTNPEQAQKELEIHCKAVDGAELYTKHFIYLMENGEAFRNPDNQARLYSKIYKEQIEKGESDLFAHKYADLMATEEYIELGCFSEAKEYEKSINAGLSEVYAEAFASQISEYIANYYPNYRNEKTDTILYKIEKQKIEKQLEHLK